MSCLFITHNLAVVRAIADRVAVLYHGRLCEVGPTHLLWYTTLAPYTETLLRAELTHELVTLPHVQARDVPDPAPPLRGCPFQRRCPRHIEPACDEIAPPWQEMQDGRRILCHITPDDLRQQQSAAAATA